MKVMYFTHEGFDTPNPANHLAMAMIDDFLNAGIEVYMVASHRKGINSDIPGILLDREGFTYDIVKRPVVDKTKFFRRYLEEMTYAFKAMRVWIKHKKELDIVHLQSNPTVLFSMILFKIFLHKPVLYSIFDIFPGSAYDIGVIKSKWLYNLLGLLQKPVYKMSNKIVVACEDMKKMVQQLKVPAEKIHVIVNWYDDHSVIEIPKEENRFIKKYGIDTNKFYVQFAGTIGYVFDYKMIIRVATLLKDETNIVFQIIGDGNVKKQFVDEAREKQLTNIVFYPLQPLKIVPDVYSACSICLIPLKKGVIGTGFPSKSALLMACRRVVVNSVEEDSDYFKMFNNNDIGIAVSNDSPEKVANAIRYAYENPKQLSEMAEKAKIYGERYFSRKVNTIKFIKLYKEMYIH
jgi:glycosyltransferase involved in cell wall biosynthesis